MRPPRFEAGPYKVLYTRSYKVLQGPNLTENVALELKVGIGIVIGARYWTISTLTKEP